MSAEGSQQQAPALLAQGLSHSFGEFAALEGLDLEVRAGELLALVGPNGAGKTTFLTMIAGLLEPSSGWVQVGGAEAGSIAARAATSYIPDTPVFYDDLSLNEHLEYIAGLHGVAEWSAPARRLLEQFGLSEWGDHLPSEFSHGMRQKASLAIGLVRPFALLLADEPFDGLDAASRSVLAQVLREARDGGAAVIVSTHRSEVVDSANRCVVLQEGRLVHDGAPSALQVAGVLEES